MDIKNFFIKKDLTEEEKKILTEQHLTAIRDQVKNDFYQQLDVPSLFAEPIPPTWERFLPWISIAIQGIILFKLII